MRNEKIDFLRFLGLSLIVLAHVNPPLIISQLRNFDVPLMFLVMGMSFFITESRHTSTFNYIASRFKRLVIPTWFFFSCFYIVSELIWMYQGHSEFKYSAGTIAATFALSTGIGYVWVIRIFFSVSILAILTPKSILNASIYKITFLSFGFIILNTYFLSSFYESLDVNIRALEIGTFISSTAVYLCVFLIGYKILQEDRNSIIFILFISGVIFTVVMSYLMTREGHFIPTQEDKYPPGIYYISFAIFMSLAFFVTSEKLIKALSYSKLWGIVMFISSNSIWIYLWHIAFIVNTINLNINFMFKYILVYSFSIAIVFIQVKLIKSITSTIKDDRKSKILNQIFTG
ncbi:acyltransferase [Escherichia marmotae]|uniref:acyltransferase family protein n=1 Tax=Escherichia TaxID=561 RepID=UPI0006A61970|nr:MULTISPECIES: acyltransferase [Escherichia]MCN2481276.1 acyltransferase [Escherichia coli]MDQ9243788.1 acyltransferase [Escherichia marmotae]MDQ9277312.1 acyltransferase [Escherichia marmotae]HCP5414244.1 acyltransferase [Escherichia coli]HCQ4532003.1 acyltransferase [Escherichia coli]